PQPHPEADHRAAVEAVDEPRYHGGLGAARAARRQPHGEELPDYFPAPTLWGTDPRAGPREYVGRGLPRAAAQAGADRHPRIPSPAAADRAGGGGAEHDKTGGEPP